MNLRIILFIFSTWLFSTSMFGQMVVGVDTLYGNEWINYEQEYYKIPVSIDGFYRLTYNDLVQVGVFSGANAPKGEDFQMMKLGEEIPIYVSTSGTFGTGDYIEFYGEQARGEIDKFLYKPGEHTNPDWCLFNATAAYFLTWRLDNSVTPKRIITQNNNLSGAPAKEEYCMHTISEVYFNQWRWGESETGAGGSHSCQFGVGEGPSNRRLAVSNIVRARTHPSIIYSTGPDATFKTSIYTEGGNHDVEILWNTNSVLTESHNGWAIKHYEFKQPASTLKATNRVDLKGNYSADDKHALIKYSLEYPRVFDFTNDSIFFFKLEGSTGDKYLEISNFNTNGLNPVLYDFTNDIRIETMYDATDALVKVRLPESLEDRELVLLRGDFYRPLEGIEKRNFVDYRQFKHDYVIVSHPLLYGNDNYVQQYADYRATPLGGGFNPIVVDVNQLYDQFAYGIDFHEISMRNFVHYAIKNWDTKYLFIIGKGMRYLNVRYQYEEWKDWHFVPGFGTPQSDHLFATSNYDDIPKIPIGRLAARTPEHVKLYYDKVLEYENTLINTPQTIEDKSWMKNVMHLGGGDIAIQNTVRGRLEALEDIIVEDEFGANVISFYKTSTDVVQGQDELFKNTIDNGVSIISFFGHSAPTTLDFDLGDPQDYDNKGKYPFIYAIGCHTNRMFEEAITLAEDWVLVEDKGAIAFLGATWETTLGNLSAYGLEIYKKISKDNYGDRLGDIIKATIEDFTLSSSFYAKQLKQVLILHGDPAIKLNSHIGADYIIDKDKTYLSSSLVNTSQDSFKLTCTVTNIGSVVTDSITLKVEHEYPNGSIQFVDNYKFKAPTFEDTVMVTIPLLDKTIIGLNKIHLFVDSEDVVLERPDPLAEQNNRYSIPFYVVSNDILPMAPTNFGIESTPSFVLKASTVNTLESTQNYYIQIDTTETFDSPLFTSEVITQSGGLLKWEPSIEAINNTVYYWRVSIDSTLTEGNGFKWNNRSFVYLDGASKGWNQSHYYQYQKDNFDNVEINQQRIFNFSRNEAEIKNYTGPFGTGDNGFPNASISLFHNNIRLNFWWFAPPGINIVVFDQYSLEAWKNQNIGGSQGLYGSHYTTGGEPELNFFPYNTQEVQGRQDAINLLENIIPDGSYVIFEAGKGYMDYLPESWGEDSISYNSNLFQVLEANGATQIRSLVGNPRPYSYFYQKGNPSFEGTKELVADSVVVLLEGNYLIEGFWNNGSLESTVIGPAKKWESLVWELGDYDSATDDVKIEVIGIDNDENESVIKTVLAGDFDHALTGIDANQYPYIRLRLISSDLTYRTMPQLNFWRVLYDRVPEAALVPNQLFVFDKDTLYQGEPLKFEMQIDNISDSDMDSLLIKYTIVNQGGQPINILERGAPLRAGNSTIAKLEYSTVSLLGENQFIIDMNPNDDQAELTHINNIAVKEFFVVKDDRNPILDVTFDGVHIMDGDIVSSKPEIIMTLLDDNDYLLLSDTSLFRVFLRFPDVEEELVEYEVDGNILSFYPASIGGDNKARMEFNPDLLEDGVYQLVVRAEDAAGNKSGEVEYRVDFEIITKTSVSNVLNYPNPFSTSTQFVFTLTGESVPDYMKIQIMTVSGKIIREITMDELGPIKVGNNMTEFKWNGTDEYGDKLANGVYLYRVVTRKDDAEYEKYDTNTNQYFKNGFGKMMILR